MESEASDLQRALDNDEFFPVLQPIVELRTGQLTGFELLARRRLGSFTTVVPEDFIPQIEACGLGNRLTESLLEKAFASAPLLQTPLHLAVNLSPLQLQDPGLPAVIAGCAERGNFSLDRLTIEVTESALLKDLPRARAVVQELKQLRCRLALDDFGTGYSSLRHLEALPFDKLKVDRSFVGSMTDARESRKIVAAVIGLGQSLGLVTVAEGVETPAQARMLLWLGCDLAQGWLYGKPAPVEEVPRMLAMPQQIFDSVMPAAPDSSVFVGLDSLPAQRLAQIQAIYDGAPVGLCFLDPRMRYVSLNRRLAELNGAPVAAHLGKTVAEVIPHLFPLVEPFIRRALQGEPVIGVEIQKPPRQDQSPQTILLSYQPARDEAGEVIGVSVAIMDITAHRRTEEALHESISHFRYLLELGPHVPWVLNDKGEVIDASSRWESLTGQPLEQAMGNGWKKMLHPDDVARVAEAVRTSLASGQPIDVYYRVRKPDSDWRLMRSRGSPRMGSSGKIVGLYGVLEEVACEPGSSPEALASGLAAPLSSGRP